jgi:hypothetical protein
MQMMVMTAKAMAPVFVQALDLELEINLTA